MGHGADTSNFFGCVCFLTFALRQIGCARINQVGYTSKLTECLCLRITENVARGRKSFDFVLSGGCTLKGLHASNAKKGWTDIACFNINSITFQFDSCKKSWISRRGQRCLPPMKCKVLMCGSCYCQPISVELQGQVGALLRLFSQKIISGGCDIEKLRKYNLYTYMEILISRRTFAEGQKVCRLSWNSRLFFFITQWYRFRI